MVDILAGKTDPCCLSAVVLFAPVLTVMQGQVPRSQQPKISTAVKGKRLIFWESIISISVPENSEHDRLTKTVYP